MTELLEIVLPDRIDTMVMLPLASQVRLRRVHQPGTSPSVPLELTAVREGTVYAIYRELVALVEIGIAAR